LSPAPSSCSPQPHCPFSHFPTPHPQTFGVSHRELRAMTVSAADYTFLPDKEKRALRKRLQASLGAVVEVAEEGEEEEEDTFAPLPSSKLVGLESSESIEPPPEPQATPERRSWVGRRSWGSRRSSSGGESKAQEVPVQVQSSRPRFSWRSLWVKSG